MSSAELCLIVVAAATISAGLIIALRPQLQRYVLARPNARSSHRVPTPQGGGIAVIAATIGVAVVVMTAFRQSGSNWVPLLLVFSATAFIALVGAVDDIRTIEVMPRLLLQAVAVGAMVAALPAELRVVPLLPWWIERAVLLLGGLWFVNLVNFMDGIDWMTVAEVVPVCAGLGILGLMGALPAHGVVVALALGGAVIGFAPFNRPAARLFLGDVGSLPIGLVLAWLLILMAGQGHVAAALLLPLYYLADATITLLRRLADRERFWEAHRSHFYQRATERGFSVPEVVARVFMVNLILIALAVATVRLPGPTGDWIAVACGAALVGWLLASFARGKRSTNMHAGPGQ
jgi:UDP-N-acetylmuramyl pentapeptide phosphotransferase/UDP-N-acetylglucosamine-1-phosphate transferase